MKFPTAAYAVLECDIEHWSQLKTLLRRTGALRPSTRSRSGAGAGELVPGPLP